MENVTQSRWEVCVYDTDINLWHKEDDQKAMGFTWGEGGLYMLTQQGEVWIVSKSGQDMPDGEEEAPFVSFLEFGDMVENDPNKKGVSKIQVRLELEAGAQVKICMQFDSDGVWHTVSTLGPAQKRSYYLPIIPRRCDHFKLRLEGLGQWKLWSLVRESYSGSEL